MARFLTSFGCSILMLLICAPSQAQEGLSLERTLEARGLEAVSVAVEGDVVYARVEDPSYRGTYRGAAAALEALHEQAPQCVRYELVVTEYGTPQVAVHATHDGTAWDVAVDYDIRPIQTALASATRSGSPYGHIDATVIPMVSIENSDLDHFCDYTVALAPTLATSLWKGNRIRAQIILPISYYTDHSDTKRFVRLGTTNISQELIGGGRWKWDLSAGTFLSCRWGLHTQLTYHWSETFATSAQAGYTGACYGNDDGWHAGGLKEFNFFVKADYYERHTNLQAQLMAGRFMYGDYGVRGDLTRHFGDYAIGVFGILAHTEVNAGFHFAIPFGGRKQRRTGFLRVRLPEYFDWEYNMKSNFEYISERLGQQYETLPDENRSAHYWKAQYVENYLRKCLDGTLK